MSNAISSVARFIGGQVKPLLHARHLKLRSVSLAVVFATTLLVSLIAAPPNPAQTELAGVYGRVTDASGAVIADAEVEIRNTDTGIATTVRTNQDGLYTIPSLHPGNYLINVRKVGFKSVTITQVTLNVQDNVVRNFELQIGSISETVTITADQLNINTTDASVSTVIDRQFAENLPMNGRSFQTLIDLTPGVVLVSSNSDDNGQFSVNGQRASSNYWSVDGVSANTGVSASGGNALGGGPSGAIGSFSVLGGTNSLVSVDAMQEFRIQTSTFAPEFGRTPGAQISIATRSGTNQFHGTAFDYLRNDVLDANNWFNTAVTPSLPKARERQNDFGGTFAGPIRRDRTFFFFSYEGLRLRLPTTELTAVPDTNPSDPLSRQFAAASMQPYLNSFPLPNGPEILSGTGAHQGVAEFNASFSNPASLDAYSFRLDHKFSDKWSIFGRYAQSPSSLAVRGGLGTALSIVQSNGIDSYVGTMGITGTISPAFSNDLRFNYSRVETSSRFQQDSFGGAVPLTSLPFPNPFTANDGLLFVYVISQASRSETMQIGRNGHAVQRQINLVDSLSAQKGTHSVKFGIDFRRLTPQSELFDYALLAEFLTQNNFNQGSALSCRCVQNNLPVTFLFRNLGTYAQDTWRLAPRVTLTYGLRWDIDFVPQLLNGNHFAALSNFDTNDLSSVSLAPVGTTPYHTSYGDVAPRIGLAYQLSPSGAWQTVLRGGFGLFYDLASSQVGESRGAGYPFGASARVAGPFPFSPPPPLPPVSPANVPSGLLFAYDPNLKQPLTLQWNVAVEQGIGQQQVVSVSYIGASGRDLLQSGFVFNPSSNVRILDLVTNRGTSNYNALQVQFQRRLSHRLQALTSYTWSHSIDTGSAGSFGDISNCCVVPGTSANANRGASSFDIRHGFSAALTYELPGTRLNRFVNSILSGWSVQNFVLARSAPPVNVSDSAYFFVLDNAGEADIRPDLVPGQPLYLYGSQYAGGKAFNPAAFTDPPIDPNTGNPARQGTTPRNFLRGFGAVQWDFAVHRDFPIRESVKLQFRAEMFNVLNHPNFGPPNGSFLSPQNGGPGAFGVSNAMLGQSLNAGNLGGGALSPLYQIGGPRSIQLALKLFF